MKITLGAGRAAVLRPLLLALVVLGLAALAACQQQDSPAEAPAAPAAAAAAPTSVPDPSAPVSAPQPTPVPEPTAIPTPSPDPTATAAVPAGPAVVPVVDLGDAPDGGVAGYADAAVQASFPTLASSGGPRIAKSGFETLGSAVSGDDDAKLTNADEDDDGVTGMAVSLDAAPLASLQLDIGVAAEAPETTRYLNVLIDLNADGTWGGTAAGGEPEWVVQNQAIDVAPGTITGLATSEFAFSDGMRIPENAWMRVLLTRIEIAGNDWDGGGAFEFGEVEDYLVTVPAEPRFTMTCPEQVSLAGGPIVTVECTIGNYGSAGEAELVFTRELSPDDLSRFGGTLPDFDAGEQRSVSALLVKRDAEMAFSYTVGDGATPPGSVLDGRVVPLVNPPNGSFTATEAVQPESGSLSDEADDLFHGDPTISPVRQDNTVDTRHWGAGLLVPGTDPIGEIPGANGVFACGQTTVDTGATVVCGGGLAAGPHVIVWNTLAAPVPVDAAESVRTYWTMFADPDPGNDFQALPRFANDVLGASDTHYWLDWDGIEWRLRRTTGARLTESPTGAWAVIVGSTVAMVIPQDELGPLDALRVGVSGYSGPLDSPYGVEATSDRAPGAQQPLAAMTEALQWTLPFRVLARRTISAV